VKFKKKFIGFKLFNPLIWRINRHKIIERKFIFPSLSSETEFKNNFILNEVIFMVVQSFYTISII
jgi:hypothetical protein